jgi:outer membrane protein OmpA-like peptidoglycan-associated protein
LSERQGWPTSAESLPRPLRVDRGAVTGWRTRALALLCGAILMAGCSGGSSGGQADSSSETSPPASADAPETPAVTRAPTSRLSSFDDMNQDGQPDPTCGTRDFKAGLVLRLPCEPGWYANDPSEGTTFVPGSLAALPGLPDDVKEQVLNDVSANAIASRDEAGKQVIVFFIHSDTLFAVGAATLSGPARDTLDGLTRNISRTWPAATVQVRGHTDSTGSAAANQTLSEQRAANVANYLASQGIDRARLSSVGLGPTAPIVLEDGDAGRRENRRVELVVRLP